MVPIDGIVLTRLSMPLTILGIPHQDQHKTLLAILCDHKLHQTVNIQTRKERILDLVLVNNL
jgi:hypothetical protein